jgi:uncharacterized protein (TIGR02145 family)
VITIIHQATEQFMANSTIGFAVSDSRNIAPNGWHIPTDEEWTTLKNYMAAKLGISGFEAKSSFNTAFKKDTGMTPTEFRNNKNDKKNLTGF